MLRFNYVGPSAATVLMAAACASLALAAAAAASAAQAAPVRGTQAVADVFVYGSTPAGVAAAVAAADGGARRVVVAEPLRSIGGMGSAGGLGLNDQQMSNLTAVTGLAAEWCRRNGEHYGHSGKMVNHPDMYVGEASFWSMLNESGSVTVWTDCRVTSVARAKPSGDATAACLKSATLLCGGKEQRTVTASVFIDASYDAEVMVAAGGIDYTWGREPSSAFNESLAGVQLLGESLESFKGLNVSGTWPNGTVIPYVSPAPVAAVGSGDDALMAFQHRACLTTDAGTDRWAPIREPDGYDEADFELLQRQIDAVMQSGKYPNGPPFDYFTDLGHFSADVYAAGRNKYTACCGTGPVDSDQPMINAGWANATWEERQRIIDAHTYYLMGSFFYLQHGSRVPDYTRKDAARFGLCADEWPDNGNWPPQLYVRASVRLQGEVLLTQNNLASPRSKPQSSVSMGCWEFDQHTMSRHVDAHGQAINEGFFRHAIDPGVPPGTTGTGGPSHLWYDVPFGAMVPKRGQASNLMVPVALSTTSVAFSSTRIETMYMDLGAACGVAARQLLATARAEGYCPALSVQDVNVTEVQHVLSTSYNQRVRGPWW